MLVGPADGSQLADRVSKVESPDKSALPMDQLVQLAAGPDRVDHAGALVELGHGDPAFVQRPLQSADHRAPLDVRHVPGEGVGRGWRRG